MRTRLFCTASAPPGGPSAKFGTPGYLATVQGVAPRLPARLPRTPRGGRGGRARAGGPRPPPAAACFTCSSPLMLRCLLLLFNAASVCSAGGAPRDMQGSPGLHGGFSDGMAHKFDLPFPIKLTPPYVPWWWCLSATKAGLCVLPAPFAVPPLLTALPRMSALRFPHPRKTFDPLPCEEFHGIPAAGAPTPSDARVAAGVGSVISRC